MLLTVHIYLTERAFQTLLMPCIPCDCHYTVFFQFFRWHTSRCLHATAIYIFYH